MFIRFKEIKFTDYVFIFILENHQIIVPLILLAKILSTENVYQLFNAGAAGGPYKKPEELKRVFEIKKFGAEGRQMLQVKL